MSLINNEISHFIQSVSIILITCLHGKSLPVRKINLTTELLITVLQ